MLDVIVTMHEDIYYQIPEDFRVWFKYVKFIDGHEYEKNKGDPHYMTLYKEMQDSKKRIKNYVRNKKSK